MLRGLGSQTPTQSSLLLATPPKAIQLALGYSCLLETRLGVVSVVGGVCGRGNEVVGFGEPEVTLRTSTSSGSSKATPLAPSTMSSTPSAPLPARHSPSTKPRISSMAQLIANTVLHRQQHPHSTLGHVYDPARPKKLPTSSAGAPRRNFAVLQHPPPAPSKANTYHGHEFLAEVAARFITHLFACPDYPQSSTQAQAKLPYFIAYALHRTKLHPSITFAALVLLQWLKARFPSARGSSGHRLFISAYMISSKVMCDDTYSNKLWCIVAQGMFTLREVNQMEREMCTYLDWELTVDNPILSNFEDTIRVDFGEDKDHRSYPNYPTTFVSKRSARAEQSKLNTPFDEKSSSTSPVPGFPGHNSPTPGTPTKIPWDNAPETLSPTYSNATSPASSGSPAAPVGGPETNPKIRGIDTSPNFGPVGGGVQVSSTHPLKPRML